MPDNPWWLWESAGEYILVHNQPEIKDEKLRDGMEEHGDKYAERNEAEGER